VIAVAKRLVGFLLWLALRLYVFVARRPMRRLRPDEADYIDRYFLTSTPQGDETGTPGWYLQRIYRADPDTRLHTHPWAHSKSLILRGGYGERKWAHEHVTQTRWYTPLTWNTFPNRYVQHRIFWVWGDTWTLFYAGPKHGKGWGFVGNTRTDEATRAAHSVRGVWWGKALRPVGAGDLVTVEGVDVQNCARCGGCGYDPDPGAAGYEGMCVACQGNGTVPHTDEDEPTMPGVGSPAWERGAR
jgi:hypothetical protein